MITVKEWRTKLASTTPEATLPSCIVREVLLVMTAICFNSDNSNRSNACHVIAIGNGNNSTNY